MIHKTLKAATTTTDQGVFTALAATYSLDRDGERIAKGAFGETIKQWQDSGKNIPLHFDHQASPENIIGWVDPKSMKETDEGLIVQGQLDLEQSEVAKEVWRSMRNNAVGLSFGFLSESRKGKDGVVELYDIDLYEISIVGAPANNQTRLLSLKSVLQEGEEAGIEEDAKQVQEYIDSRLKKFIETEDVLQPDAIIEVHDSQESEAPSAEELRKQTFDFALELAGGRQKAQGGDDEGLAAFEEALKDRRVQIAIWQALKSVAETGEEPETPETSETSAVEDGKDEEPEKAKSAPQDPLRKRTFDHALEIFNGGIKVPHHLPEPEPEPEPLNEAALRRRSLQAALAIARGD